jgi:hypothetical protein
MLSVDVSAMGIAEAKEHWHFPRLWRDLATNADALRMRPKLQVLRRFKVYG